MKAGGDAPLIFPARIVPQLFPVFPCGIPKIRFCQRADSCRAGTSRRRLGPIGNFGSKDENPDAIQ
jgi:hypothetical protein